MPAGSLRREMTNWAVQPNVSNCRLGSLPASGACGVRHDPADALALRVDTGEFRLSP